MAPTSQSRVYKIASLAKSKIEHLQPELGRTKIKDIRGTILFAFVEKGCEFNSICMDVGTRTLHFPIHSFWKKRLDAVSDASIQTVALHEWAHLAYDDFLNTVLNLEKAKEFKKQQYYNSIDELRKSYSKPPKSAEEMTETLTRIRRQVDVLFANKDRLNSILAGYEELVADTAATLVQSSHLDIMALSISEFQNMSPRSNAVLLRRFSSSYKLDTSKIKEDVLWEHHNIFAETRRYIGASLLKPTLTDAERQALLQKIMLASALETKRLLEEAVDSTPFSRKELNDSLINRIQTLD